MASATRSQLYIWPGDWGLPSVDAHCLAAALYLQLVAPGRFLLVESADPDSAPHGQLPYLLHDNHAISGFSVTLVHGGTNTRCHRDNSPVSIPRS